MPLVSGFPPLTGKINGKPPLTGVQLEQCLADHCHTSFGGRLLITATFFLLQGCSTLLDYRRLYLLTNG